MTDPHEQIRRNFRPHEHGVEQTAAASAARARFEEFAHEVVDLIPPGRERALVLTHLETASFYAIAGISRDPEGPR